MYFLARTNYLPGIDCHEILDLISDHIHVASTGLKCHCSKFKPCYLTMSGLVFACTFAYLQIPYTLKKTQFLTKEFNTTKKRGGDGTRFFYLGNTV